MVIPGETSPHFSLHHVTLPPVSAPPGGSVTLRLSPSATLLPAPALGQRRAHPGCGAEVTAADQLSVRPSSVTADCRETWMLQESVSPPLPHPLPVTHHKRVVTTTCDAQHRRTVRPRGCSCPPSPSSCATAVPGPRSHSRGGPAPSGGKGADQSKCTTNAHGADTGLVNARGADTGLVSQHHVHISSEQF